MSHKMFYQEMKERESILQMINQTVSHELRNPLNAISGQLKKARVTLELIPFLINELKKDHEVLSQKL